MNSRDFCFWLQGLLEVGEPKELSERQVEIIKQHLALVFKHDPSIDAEACKHPPVEESSRETLFLEDLFRVGQPEKLEMVCSGKPSGELLIC